MRPIHAELVLAACLSTGAAPSLPSQKAPVIVGGRVVAESDGAPIAGASVRLHLPRIRTRDCERWDEGTTLAELSTDAEGVFTARVPASRDAVAFVEAAGFGPKIVGLHEGGEEPLGAAFVPLSRSGTLELAVSHAQGARLAGLSARLHTGAGNLVVLGQDRFPPYVLDPSWTATLDADGRARLPDLPADVPLLLELLRDDTLIWRAPYELLLAPGETPAHAVVLGTESRVLGRLVDARDGLPIAGQQVWLEPATEARARFFPSSWCCGIYMRATTDAAGSFIFENVAAGEWWIGPAPVRGASCEPGELAPAAELLRVPPGGEDQHRVLRAHRGHYLNGRVLDTRRNTLVSVTCRSSEHGEVAPSTVRPDGSFRAGPLVPGDYEVQVEALWDDAASPARFVDSRSPSELALRLHVGAELRVRLIRDGLPVARRAAVWLVPRHAAFAGEWPCRWSYEADGLGAIDFPSVPSGTYDLLATTERGESGSLRDLELDVTRPSLDLPLELHPGATLELRSRSLVEWRVVEVRHAGRAWHEVTIRADTPEPVTLPPGAFELRVLDGQSELLEQRTGVLVRDEHATLELP